MFSLRMHTTFWIEFPFVREAENLCSYIFMAENLWQEPLLLRWGRYGRVMGRGWGLGDTHVSKGGWVRGKTARTTLRRLLSGREKPLVDVSGRKESSLPINGACKAGLAGF